MGLCIGIVHSGVMLQTKEKTDVPLATSVFEIKSGVQVGRPELANNWGTSDIGST